MIHLLYGELAKARRRYYERRPNARRRLRAPVISVGGLTVGGSGKTPVVAALARLLLDMGERPAILSRGYARERGADGVVVASDGTSILSDVAHAGDEPFMLAHAVQGVAVLVSPNRYLAGRLAETRFACSVHLLDDGFQHFELVRTIDLLVTPPSELEDTRTLPRGRLREPLDTAAVADALLVPVDEGTTPLNMAKRLRVAEAFGIERAIEPPRPLRMSGWPTEGSPMRAFAVAGIARPERFFADLGRMGWQLTGTLRFPDHHCYSTRDVAETIHAAQKSGANVILTTEKDRVRLPDSIVQPDAPIAWASVPLRVSFDTAFRPWLERRLARGRAGDAA